MQSVWKAQGTFGDSPCIFLYYLMWQKKTSRVRNQEIAIQRAADTCQTRRDWQPAAAASLLSLVTSLTPPARERSGRTWELARLETRVEAAWQDWLVRRWKLARDNNDSGSLVGDLNSVGSRLVPGWLGGGQQRQPVTRKECGWADGRAALTGFHAR